MLPHHLYDLAKATRTRQLTWPCISRCSGRGRRRRRKKRRGVTSLSPAPIRTRHSPVHPRRHLHPSVPVVAHTCPSVVVVARDRPRRHLHIPCSPSPALVRGRRHLHLSAVVVTCTFRGRCHLHIPRLSSPALSTVVVTWTFRAHRHLRSSALAVTCARLCSSSPANSGLAVTCTVHTHRHLHGPHSSSPALVRGRLRPHPSVLFVHLAPLGLCSHACWSYHFGLYHRDSQQYINLINYLPLYQLLT